MQNCRKSIKSRIFNSVKPMYDFYKESSIYKTIRNYLNTSNVSPLLGNINLLKYFM